MKNNKKLLAAMLVVVMCLAMVFAMVACDPNTPDNPDTPQNVSVTSDTLYVKKVEDLPEDFIMGMDSSCVPSLEKAGVKFYDFDGNETDVFKILSDNGITTIRVRVWNNPYDYNGLGFGGGNCDINNALEIGKRATKYGMNLMVDFHYSDFWADPAKQKAPRAWANMTIDEKTNALYQYTKDCLQLLKDEGVNVGIVQVGNETNGKMCGEVATSSWAKLCQLFAAGSQAVREVLPDALVALHFANPEKADNYRNYAKKLAYYSLDYDVFASSYYPFWHGTLENLSTILSEIAETYDKKVMVAETSYAFTTDDFDFGGNTIGTAGVTKNYPFTVQGQANCVRDVIDTIVHTTNGIGVCYWEGTWISVGGKNYDENKALWEEYGTGWATEAAGIYDDDVKMYGGGGSQVDNQTFFTTDGKPLESLKVWSLVRNGNTEVQLKADAVEDTTLICDLEEKVVLPDKINAVMTDDSKQEIQVEWKTVYQMDSNVSWPYSEGLSRMNNGEPTKYDVVGVAGGMEAHCYVSMIEFNFVQNYSFEEDSNKDNPPKYWEVTSKTENKKEVFECYVEKDPLNSITGDMHYHFWGRDNDSVEITLQQTITGLSAGKYKFQISISGGDGGDTEIYAFVKIGDTLIKSDAMTLDGYQQWVTGKISSFDYDGTSTLVVGIYIKCSGTGAGAWGKIDDALLNSVSE